MWNTYFSTEILLSTQWMPSLCVTSVLFGSILVPCNLVIVRFNNITRTNVIDLKIDISEVDNNCHRRHNNVFVVNTSGTDVCRLALLEHCLLICDKLNESIINIDYRTNKLFALYESSVKERQTETQVHVCLETWRRTALCHWGLVIFSNAKLCLGTVQCAAVITREFVNSLTDASTLKRF